MNRRIDTGVRHQAVRGLQLIWLAFLASIIFYLLILMLLSQQSDVAQESLVEVLRPLFWVISTLLAIASFVWRQQVADLDRRRRRMSTARGFTRLRVACIVTWGLSEAVAILGLVLGALTYRFADYAPLVSVGILLLFIHRPAAWPVDRFLREDHR